MTSIALLTAHVPFPWLRQVPADRTVGDIRFTLGTIEHDCALLVVYDDPGVTLKTTLPRERRIVILSEPPGIKTYHPKYLEQFGTVLGPLAVTGYSGRLQLSQPALPWFYGIAFTPDGLKATETLETLLALRPDRKIEAISVVLSRKSQLPKHRARVRLVEHLQSRLGDRLHVFGRGFREISDKSEAILPYAYHLVLENNDIDHFWTEKMADAFLGWSLPLFSGAANIGQYFAPESYIPLDIRDPEEVAAKLEAILAEAPYLQRLSAIEQARNDVLTRYNLFPILRSMLEDRAIEQGPIAEAETLLLPNKQFSYFERLRGKARRVVAHLSDATGLSKTIHTR